MDFKTEMINCILANNRNDYTDNYDKERYGGSDPYETVTVKSTIKKLIFKNKVSIDQQNNTINRIYDHLIPYFPSLEKLYNGLSDSESKDLMVLLVCFRMLGYRKVKLPLSGHTYFSELKKMHLLEDKSDFIDPHFMDMKLHKFDLNNIKKNVKIYFTANGLLIDFILEQYRYKTKNTEIGASKGDIVVDAGGCWGDTALYFADIVGETGKVFTFEFIPLNIKIFERNIALNPELEKNIELIKRPVWCKSNVRVFFKDHGPASCISLDEFDGYDDIANTLSIDDLCKDFDRVDFIKMDIEGAEPDALKGARNTIMKFKPKLAIAIYHSMGDFTDIPLWILNLNLGYKIYMGHYTISEEETVIFAAVNTINPN